MRYRVFLATVGLAVTLAYSQQAVAQARQINIDDVLETVRKKYDLPALAAAVILRGEIVAAGAVGVRKIGADVPVTINDQFHLGYGYGWFVAKDGTLSHTGSNGRSFAQISIIPRTKFAVLIVTNQGGEVAVQACSQLPSVLLARCARN